MVNNFFNFASDCNFPTHLVQFWIKQRSDGCSRAKKQINNPGTELKTCHNDDINNM